MKVRFLRNASGFALAAILMPTGCKHQSDTFKMSGDAASWNASRVAARQELTQIPPPAKDSYLAIHQESQWQNPFLSVASNMIQLRIYLPDENSSSFDRGGLTRLNAARKQVLNVRLKDLPEALDSLPANAWPYGRVVAINEALEAPENQPRLQQNVSVTTNALRDMGIVVDSWSQPELESGR